MKIIAVMNQKGGVGKTMTSAAIAYILGEEMKNRVLIADADQQGNVSMLYGVYDPEGLGMPELLEAHQAAGGAYSTKELIQQTTYSNIQIIPANGYLMRTNAGLGTMVFRCDQNGEVKNWEELDDMHYGNVTEATEGHIRMWEKWTYKGETGVKVVLG